MHGSGEIRIHDGDGAGQAKLTNGVPLATLTSLQDRFAALGRVTVCICETDGTPITDPAWGSRFSDLVGGSTEGRRAFAACVRRCASEAQDGVRPTCLEGLDLYSVPIRFESSVLATLVVGSRSSAPVNRAAVEKAAARFGVDPDELWKSAAKIDPYQGGAPRAIYRFADILADTIASLYGQAARIERQVADLVAVHSFTELLTGALDLQDILDRTVRRVVEVMGVKASAIRLINHDNDELVLKAVCNLSEEYLKKGPVLLHENAIDAAAFAGETVYIPDAPNDPRSRYPDHARREGLVSGLSVPMTYRGETIGVVRVYTAQRYTFSDAEIKLLRSISAQAAAAVITGRLWREQADTERLQGQLNAAQQIQRRMLPRENPSSDRLDIGAVYDPTLQLGGDFYDFIRWEDGRVGVCIADVVGKGLPAALMMASIRSALRANALRFDAVEVVMEFVNRHMCNDTLVSEFATVFYGVISPDARRLVYTNAGHPLPVLLRKGTVSLLGTGGMVIGVLPDTEYEPESLELYPGDLIVFVTDGVTEAFNFEGEPFGTERLLKSIQARAQLEAQPMARELLWDVRRFVGLKEQTDDITIVTVKIR